MDGQRKWFDIIAETCRHFAGEAVKPGPSTAAGKLGICYFSVSFFTLEKYVLVENATTETAISNDNVENLKSMIFNWIFSQSPFSLVVCDCTIAKFKTELCELNVTRFRLWKMVWFLK